MTRLALTALLLTPCGSTPPAATGSLEGEAKPPVATSSPLPAATPQTSPPAHRGAKASRSRTRQGGRSGTGGLTNTTCYLATGNRTASGSWPAPGDAASNRYPFGTRLLVQGIGVVTVRDRIGHSSELDLFMTSRAACLSFGRKHLRVRVVR